MWWHEIHVSRALSLTFRQLQGQESPLCICLIHQSLLAASKALGRGLSELCKFHLSLDMWMRGHLISPLSLLQRMFQFRGKHCTPPAYLASTTSLRYLHLQKQSGWLLRDNTPRVPWLPHTFTHMCWNIYRHTIYMTAFTLLPCTCSLHVCFFWCTHSCTAPHHLT